MNVTLSKVLQETASKSSLRLTIFSVDHILIQYLDDTKTQLFLDLQLWHECGVTQENSVLCLLQNIIIC